MNCPKCGEPTDPGAAFCGNCGQPLLSSKARKKAATASLPAYAQPIAHRHHVKLSLALTFATLGIVGSLFMPLIGLVLGITGIVLASLTPTSTGQGLKIVAMILSTLAVLAALGSWVYAIAHQPQVASNSSSSISSAPVNTAEVLATPCYSVNFGASLHIEQIPGSCEMNAFNAPNIDSATNDYKVLGSQEPSLKSSGFNTIAKQAVENDIKDSLPSFKITHEQAGTFAGAPAYFVQAVDIPDKTAFEEAAVLHGNGLSSDNFFVLVHATAGTTTDLSQLASGWHWSSS